MKITDKYTLLLTDFANYIIKISQKEKKEKLFFLSREGLIFKKFVDKLIQLNKITNITTVYLPASRKVCSVASLNNEKDIFDLFKEPMAPMKTSEILKYKFNLDKKEIATIMLKLNNKDILIHKHSTSKEFANLVKICKNEILAKAKQTKENLIDLYKSLDVDNGILVDIGYRGSLQYYINKVLYKKIKLKSIYLISEKMRKEIKEKDYYSYFKYQKNSTIDINRIFLEFLFMANHGTLIDIKKTNTQATPIWDKKNKANKEVILIQKKALSKNVIKSENNKESLIKQLITPYSKSEIIRFKNSFLDDSFGGKKKRFIINPKLFGYRLTENELKDALITSEWLEGALFLANNIIISKKENKDILISNKKTKITFRKIKKLIFNPKEFILDSNSSYSKIIKKYLKKNNLNKKHLINEYLIKRLK